MLVFGSAFNRTSWGIQPLYIPSVNIKRIFEFSPASRTKFELCHVEDPAIHLVVPGAPRKAWQLKEISLWFNQGMGRLLTKHHSWACHLGCVSDFAFGNSLSPAPSNAFLQTRVEKIAQTSVMETIQPRDKHKLKSLGIIWNYMVGS